MNFSLSERNPDATIYVGGIDQKVTQEVLWELFSQCGIVVNVHLPKDKITGEHQGYGFVEFKSEEDADYSIKIMHLVKLYGKPIKVNKASQDKRTQEVGANIFIGNLDQSITEQQLHDTFSQFGLIISRRIVRDPDNDESKGYAFVSYDNFEAADAAINTMNGQFFGSKKINVQYAFKKDSKGERHGSAAERLLAANKPQQQNTVVGHAVPVPLVQKPIVNRIPDSLMINNQLPVPNQMPPPALYIPGLATNMPNLPIMPPPIPQRLM
ncbi:splicing factor subunit 4, putative [Ichthyophthirius multifiliis]|uniref:Splicing factor subunit 4, putative n=1 Tax=Ichthyophthirius multifiliis TaxID=5932 RepID=G0R144_ICHMU|nr:splicing factor subunit 4, putative [Ichthyophthirius multifiliis]EGR28811.1 splicing factor subunit 4, putative [Ichthyophthirius multifiliis]|eukprot:XP_004030047.1 splicing factor subunit 4, putative [Ichthyophthirius multifiliis]